MVPSGLYRDTCVSNTIYLLAHKLSTGSLFFALHVGSLITFGGHPYTVHSVTKIARPDWHPSLAPWTLQTCWTDSGSIWLIIRAR